MKKDSITKKFFKNTSGNIASTFTIMALPIMLSIGATIDYSNSLSVTSKVQAASDTAAIAAILSLDEGNTHTEAIQTAEKVFHSNLPANDIYDAYTPKITFNDNGIRNTINVRVNGDIQNRFMQLVGIKTVPLNVHSRTITTYPREEITLVLDISQSMEGSRLDAMKAAAKEFIQTVKPIENSNGYRIINIVPFANRVNIGSSYAHWLDPSETSVPFAGCFEIEDQHENLQDRIPAKAPGEMIPYRNTINDTRNNPYCPTSNNEMKLFSSDETALIDYIDSLEVGFGTATDLALQWGWRTLSPQWRPHYNGAKNFPRNFRDRHFKSIVLLTDGRIFRQEFQQPHPIAANKGRDNDADNNFNKICADIESNTDIRVYTIGYDLNGTEPTFRSYLENCASNGGEYFDASLTNISSTFDFIANDLLALRLAR